MRVALAAVAVALALMVAACSDGATGGSTTTTSPERTVAAATTTTTISLTTTTALTTTTTIPYNTVEDLQAQFQTVIEGLATCIPIVNQELETFTPGEPDPDGAGLVANCPATAFLSVELRFDTEALRALHADLRGMAEIADAYVDAAELVLRAGTPHRLNALNSQIDALNNALADWSGDPERFDASSLGTIPLAPLPEPQAIKVKVNFDRGHDAVVVPNWYDPADNADAYFTDVRWCAGRRYRVTGEDGTEYSAGCTADFEAEADPTKTVRGDGWYFVGDEIAAGTWRSRGRGDGCYWAVYDIDGDIIDNNFGPSTTTMRIRSSAYQVEMDGCGVWLYG